MTRADHHHRRPSFFGPDEEFSFGGGDYDQDYDQPDATNAGSSARPTTARDQFVGWAHVRRVLRLVGD